MNHLFNSGSSSQAHDFTPGFFDRPFTDKELDLFRESAMIDELFIKDFKEELTRTRTLLNLGYNYIRMYFWNI